MPTLSQPVDNLINGVSQQPINYRLPNQADECTNCWPSVVQGLTRRAGTQHISELAPTEMEDETLVHYIDRSPLEKYVVTIQPAGVLKVFNLITGAEATVSDLPDADYSYITSDNPKRDFSVLSLKDQTFILNKTKKVLLDAEKTPSLTNEALIWVRQAVKTDEADGTPRYKVTIKTEEAETTYSVNPTANSQELIRSIDTAIGSDFTVTTFNHVMRIVPNSTEEEEGTVMEPPIVSIETEDPVSGAGIRACFQAADTIQDLPDSAPEGFRIKVRGEVSKAQDDYYVVFRTADGKDEGVFGRGSWEETVGWDTEFKFDKTTMPQRLISSGFDTFTYGTGSWSDRIAGDADTLAKPSFVGQALSCINFFENRMVVLSDINVILSESGEYFNFWGTTSLVLPDTDPVDIEVNSPRASSLEYGMSYNRRLLLFTKEAQFVLYGSPIVTPSNVSVHPVTSLPYFGAPTPVTYGQFIYFGAPRSQYFQTVEYFLEKNGETYDHVSVSGHAAAYIPEDIKYMAASPESRCVVFVPSGDQNKLYFYKVYWQDDKKVQSAWYNFEFDSVTRIVGASFIRNILYLLLVRDGKTVLESIEFTDKDKDVGFEFTPHMDRRITEVSTSMVYDGELGTTRITPTDNLYGTSDRVLFVQSDGEFQSLAPEADGSITVLGDKTGETYFLGLNFTSSYLLPSGRLRDPQTGNVVDGHKNLLLRAVVDYEDSGEFYMTIDKRFHQRVRHAVTPLRLNADNPENVWNLNTGSAEFPVSGMLEDVMLGLESKDHLPFNALSIHSRIRTSARLG